MLHEIIVPDLAESTVEATVATWLKKSGDIVNEGEVLIELDTDKVSLEVVSPSSGQLTEISKNEGETVNVGELLGKVDDSVSSSAKSEKPVTKNEPKPQVNENPKTKPDNSEVSVTPVAKKIAEKDNIDLTKIKGSGPNGKITKNDLENKNDTQKTSTAAGPEEVIKLSRRRITIAKRLKEVQSDTVMTTTYNEVDLSSVISIRKKFQDQFVEKHGVKLGFMSFFVKATVNALQSFPHLNAELYQDELILKKYYDMGIAVATEEGLVVPVLREADKKSSAEIEKGIADLATKARERKITLEELQGGTFSITNGGVFGSLMSTPLLNPPQVGILGMHKIQEKPIAVNGEVVIRPVMVLAVTYDHRIIDGAMAVQFLVRIKNLLEDPYQLLIDA
ncbi:MAG: 2-oxoglutarate dehydrogenase complex dihydrolipoyllysine-residue succinyltransferase [Chloroflexota bacterium]|nr:2-oxoglutarate dehydrogenase complex dihydrolipoyllysine-residue succinyltransferase [Chloroflexota bacterium]MQG04775.1 2-oxoglutarate dehydrogenase complex dihydrolipoyllysine-residue succinyltransferase [SAR202 cluster bacterium]|tara:strand:- start:14852 stop:16027 length:1176 start_codon:yes stop_codon:yes gene_type:complete